MTIDIEEEISFFMRNCTPRIPDVMIDGFGLRLLRSGLQNYNMEYAASNSHLSYQGNYSRMSGDVSRIAEREYAMGYPLERVRFFLKKSAEAMKRCIELRGTLERVEFTTEIKRSPQTGEYEEKLQDVTASVDASMGTPEKGILAVFSAWLAQDKPLADSIIPVICFHAYDTETYVETTIAYWKSTVALLAGEEVSAKKWLEETDPKYARAKTLRGILHHDQKLFDAGMKGLLKIYEDDEKNYRLDKGDYFTKKGLKTPPTIYWSVECMGYAILALRKGLSLNTEHTYIRRDVMEGCV